MKKLVTLILLAFTLNLSSKSQNDEFLKTYLRNISKFKGFEMDVSYCKKGLFETDTVCNTVKIKYIRPITGISSSFLQITDSTSKTELLLLNDTSWYINHEEKYVQIIGGKNEIFGNSLFSYMPTNALFMDSIIFQKEPYWEYLKAEHSLQPVRFKVMPPDIDITSMEMTLFIDTLSLIRAKESIFAEFVEIGFQLQQHHISNFQHLDSIVLEKPEYFQIYKLYQPNPEMLQAEKTETNENQYIQTDTMNFTRLEGGSFQLPKKGFVFLDFWYVGCYHCMKASPVIDELYQEYRDKVHFYSINDTDKDLNKINNFKAKMGVHMPVLLYHWGVFAKILHDNSYPRFLILEASSGRIVWKQFGNAPELKDKLREVLESVIQ